MHTALHYEPIDVFAMLLKSFLSDHLLLICLAFLFVGEVCCLQMCFKSLSVFVHDWAEGAH